MNGMDKKYWESQYERIRKERDALAQRVADMLVVKEEGGCPRNHTELAIRVMNKRPSEGAGASLAGVATLAVVRDGVVFSRVKVSVLRSTKNNSLFVADASQSVIDVEGNYTKNKCSSCNNDIQLTTPVYEMTVPFKKYIIDCFLVKQGIMNRELDEIGV